MAADPAVKQLMLALGADKGLHGVGLFMVTPSAVVAIKPIRHLDDFKGKKIRIFASQFQKEALQRLGATPKPMTLGEVLPALQDNVLDGAIAGTTVFATMHYQDAAKYVTEIGQPVIFGIVELSKKWYDGLPADLREIVDRAASAESVNINSWVVDFNAKARQDWISGGGELISLPAEEQSAMVNALASVGEDVSATKPELHSCLSYYQRGGATDPLGHLAPVVSWGSHRGEEAMRLIESDRLTRAIAGGFALSLAFCSGAAHAQDKAQDKTYVMKITYTDHQRRPASTRQEFRRRGRARLGRQDQRRGLSRQPVRLDPTTNRRRAVRLQSRSRLFRRSFLSASTSVSKSWPRQAW